MQPCTPRSYALAVPTRDYPDIHPEERERRRKLMEAILENIPTGVVSLDAAGNVIAVVSR